MTIMKIRNLQKEFGDQIVLRDINLDIKKGARMGIVGYNGAGKTTLAEIIAGNLNYDIGIIEADIKIGYLLQSMEHTFIDDFVENDSQEFLKLTSELGLS